MDGGGRGFSEFTNDDDGMGRTAHSSAHQKNPDVAPPPAGEIRPEQNPPA